MFRSAKMLVATAAFATPVVLGVAYTGAASVGGGEDTSSEQSEQQWVLATDDGGDYTIDRWQTGDVVTIVATGPDGESVELEDLPSNIAGAVTEFESPDWTPPVEELWGTTVDGSPCYHAEHLADPAADEDGTTGAITSGEGLFALEAYPDGSVDVAYFADGNAYGHEELEAHQEGGGSYLDLEGAQPLNACEG